MNYIIAGLGNPGEEYALTRHNTGRIVLENIIKEYTTDELTTDKKTNSLLTESKIGKDKVTFIEPETFMNKSGSSIGKIVTSIKAAEKLIVIYDDFNLPLGRVKMSYNRSSGGHNGLESIIKAVKTEAFTRIRIGVSPANAKGEAKVPHGEDKVEKFILGKFRDEDLKELKKISKKVAEVLEIFMKEGRDKAMTICNQK